MVLYNIRVTEEHIKNGVPESDSDCPIALAIKEQVPCIAVSVGVEAGERVLDVGADEAEVWFTLPERANTFIQRFDARESVEPFEFDLEVSNQT